MPLPDPVGGAAETEISMSPHLLRKLGLASQAGRAVVVGGLAAVSLAVTGAALAVPGSPVSLNTDAPATATHSPEAEPTSEPTSEPSEDSTSEDAVAASDTAVTAEPTDSEAPRPTCPGTIATPTADPSDNADDQGLHCGQLKAEHRDGHHDGQGNGGLDQSSPRPHPTDAPEARHDDGSEHDSPDSPEHDSEPDGDSAGSDG